MKRLFPWLILFFSLPLLADGAPPAFYTDAVALTPRRIKGLQPGHEDHQWLEKDIKLSSGKTHYTIKNSACNDDAHPGVSYHYEGYIGMPGPSSCNWYHRGFLFIAINGQDLGAIPLADFSVLEKTPQALCQMVWRAPEATVYVRFLQLPGDDMLRCRLQWTPAAGKKVEAVQLKLICYPSFFTNKPEYGADRILVTPRLTAHHRDGVSTVLEMNAAAGQADLLFWDFNQKTNADALQRLQAGAADLRANLTATSFEATLLKNFNREAVSRELADLVVRAKEDGTARQPKLNQSLNRLIAMKQRADAGDPLASGDFAREYDVFIHDLTRLKIEALLNSPE